MATISLYGAFPLSLANKEVDWDTDEIKVALLSSAYVPAQDTHAYYSEVVANEITGTAYTAGGVALTAKTSVYTAATNVRAFDAADVDWANSTITARYGVIYNNTPATNITKPLIAYVDFAADRTSSAGLFRIAWHANGIFTVTV